LIQIIDVYDAIKTALNKAILIIISKNDAIRVIYDTKMLHKFTYI